MTRAQDDSTVRFRHNVASIWNVAVGGLCLLMMSAILGVFAWRVIQARPPTKAGEQQLQVPLLMFAALQSEYCPLPDASC